MESLNGPLIEAAPEKKPAKAPERVALGEVQAKRLDRWLAQAKEASRGFLQLTRSDLVAFLIEEHREELTPSEIKRLRSLHYDPVRHMQWIVPQIKAALVAGDTGRVAELQAELRRVELAVIPAGAIVDLSPGAPAKPRKKSRKADQSGEVKASEKTTCLAQIDQN